MCTCKPGLCRCYSNAQKLKIELDNFKTRQLIDDCIAELQNVKLELVKIKEKKNEPSH